MPPLKWGAADGDGLVKFLVQEKGLDMQSVRREVNKLTGARSEVTESEKIPLLSGGS